MGCRKKLVGLESDLSAVSSRIAVMGGVIVPYKNSQRCARSTSSSRKLFARRGPK